MSASLLLALLAFVTLTVAQEQQWLTQVWYSESDSCGGAYTGIQIPGGKCIQCLDRNDDGLFFLQTSNCDSHSTYVENCTLTADGAPYYSCKSSVFRNSGNCSALTESFPFTDFTGRCTEKGNNDGSKFFQWGEKSDSPLTSKVSIWFYENDDDCSVLVEPTVLVDEERRPIGQCNAINANSSYALISCDLQDASNPLNPIRNAVLRYYSASTDCTGDSDLYQERSAFCGENFPIAGQSMLVACSLGSLVQASFMMLLLAFYFLF